MIPILKSINSSFTAPFTLSTPSHNLPYKLKLTYYYAALFRYIYSVIAFNMIVPMRRIAGTDVITSIVSIRAAQSSALTLSYKLQIWRNNETEQALRLTMEKVIQYLGRFSYLAILIEGSIQAISPSTRLPRLSKPIISNPPLLFLFFHSCSNKPALLTKAKDLCNTILA